MLTEDLREKVEKVKQKLHYGNDVSVNRNHNPRILEPLIPYKGITIVEGIGGSGKSWFALDVSYAITSGTNFAGKFPVKRSGTVLYLNTDDPPQIISQRLNLITAKYGKNNNFYWLSRLDKNFPYETSFLFKRTGWESFTKTETAKWLEYLISTYKPVLVVLDQLLGFYGLNDDKVEDQLAFHDMLREWIKKYQCSFLLLHLKIGGFTRLKDLAEEIISYENIELKNGKATKRIIIEKANHYSPLLEEFPIRLRWDSGIHIYDEKKKLKIRD
jgi:RecA-family ATPase